MATTATRRGQIPLGGELGKMQVWRVTIGAGDTTATWKTGLTNVWFCSPESQDDQSYAVVPNSNDGTEGTSKGDIYISGLNNSSKLDVLIVGT
jgi:hypothetical protein